MHPQNASFTLEAIAARSTNYFETFVDPEGLPYFNVFLMEPCCEGAHDWPDFGDVMSRQYQAAIMLRRMTGTKVATEEVWRKKIFDLIDPKDGLLYRPATGFSKHEADFGDAALTLYALTTAYLDSGDETIRQMAAKMVDSLAGRLKAGNSMLEGFILKPLMACVRYMNIAPALELARLIVERIFVEFPVYTNDNKFPEGGHVHISLHALMGAADYALYAKEPVLYSRVDALYRFVRASGTRFGFLPECINRRGDIIMCETCALMDFAALGVTLANHGHPEYWGDMERLMRNHLVESQLVDTSWITSDNSRPDTEQFTWRDLGKRNVGSYAGWSSPTQILACHETLQWGGPELRNKIRAVQHCCGGSGVHGYFILWKNAALVENGILSVNLHLDKKLPEAEIRCSQPYEGLLSVKLDKNVAVRVRIPDFVQREQLEITINGVKQAGSSIGDVACTIIESYFQKATKGSFLELGPRLAGDLIEIRYPLELTTERISIGNTGFRQYTYDVTWKGDTVVKMQPIGPEDKMGYSDFEKKEVPIFYGESGPARLYQRDHFVTDAKPTPSPIFLDDGSLNYWKLADTK